MQAVGESTGPVKVVDHKDARSVVRFEDAITCRKMSLAQITWYRE